MLLLNEERKGEAPHTLARGIVRALRTMPHGNDFFPCGDTPTNSVCFSRQGGTKGISWGVATLPMCVLQLNASTRIGPDEVPSLRAQSEGRGAGEKETTSERTGEKWARRRATWRLRNH